MLLSDLYIVLQLPLQAVIAIAFLYQILGWSALVAFGSIVSLTFVPGYLASFSQTIQRKKLDKVRFVYFAYSFG